VGSNPTGPATAEERLSRFSSLLDFIPNLRRDSVVVESSVTLNRFESARTHSKFAVELAIESSKLYVLRRSRALGDYNSGLEWGLAGSFNGRLKLVQHCLSFLPTRFV